MHIALRIFGKKKEEKEKKNKKKREWMSDVGQDRVYRGLLVVKTIVHG